jgi:hypothetical protein
MRAAAQIEPEIDQRGGQEVRPARQRRGVLLRGDPRRLDRRGGVVVPLHPRVEQVRHREGQTRQHDEDDGDPVE